MQNGVIQRGQQVAPYAGDRRGGRVHTVKDVIHMIPGDLRKYAPDDAPWDVGTIDPEGCLVPESNVTDQEHQPIERFLSSPTVMKEDIILDLLMYDLNRIASIHLSFPRMDRWMVIAEIRIILLSIVIINII